MIARAQIRTGGRRIARAAVLIAIGILAVPFAIAMLVAGCVKDGR